MDVLRNFISMFFEQIHNIILNVVPDTGIAYGLSIIAVTIIIRLILLPLNLKSIKSQVKMQEIQPELSKLQQKYKNDPAKQQEETMKMYKEYKINPFSGCLPLLIQMPILWALYYVFSNLQGIAGARFLWVPDLSHPDPYYILPILAVATTYFSTAVIASKNKDNPQAKQMATMNIFMAGMIGFMSLRMTSALVIYWVAGSIIQIAQTLVLRAVDNKKKAAKQDQLEDENKIKQVEKQTKKKNAK